MMKTEEFEVMVKFKINLDEVGLPATRSAVVDMVKGALALYIHEMSESVTECGDWECDAQFIASTHPEFQVI
jgi:hypothetical protein